jgi:hypothetical protein
MVANVPPGVGLSFAGGFAFTANERVRKRIMERSNRRAEKARISMFLLEPQGRGQPA